MMSYNLTNLAQVLCCDAVILTTGHPMHKCQHLIFCLDEIGFIGAVEKVKNLTGKWC